jgi:hypothetical protein
MIATTKNQFIQYNVQDRIISNKSFTFTHKVNERTSHTGLCFHCKNVRAHTVREYYHHDYDYDYNIKDHLPPTLHHNVKDLNIGGGENERGESNNHRTGAETR